MLNPPFFITLSPTEAFVDVHVFRRFCDALVPLLSGARLEKIQSPLENVFVFTFYAKQKKQHLVLKVGRSDAFCYLAKERPVTDAPPPAMVMRWRKYCAGRRIVSCSADWIGRRLFLLFHTHNPDIIAEKAPETWLVLDLREGPQLILGKSPDLSFIEEDISWPGVERLADACDNWRQWPVLSPALRRLVPTLDTLDAQALLLDLEAGGGDLFVYETLPEELDQEGATAGKSRISAWPLPLGAHSQWHERVFEDPLEATSLVGDALVLGAGAEKLRHKAALPHQREAARIERLMVKLDEDEKRLQSMAQAQEAGLWLQQELWKYGAQEKLPSISTDHPDFPCLMLDAKLTVRENMQAFFHKAGRGRRGLEYLHKRRAELDAQLAAAQSRAAVMEAGAADLRQPKVSKGKKGVAAGKNAPQGGVPTLPKGVQAFRSSEGFIILRGKDAKGNGAALRAAAARDIWLHVEGGPGSHCIIRRHFSGQEIPETTLREAASLAAVKSWQKDNPTAQILCAEVRYVKPMRGAALGTVRIDKVLQSFRVDIEADIETRLMV